VDLGGLRGHNAPVQLVLIRHGIAAERETWTGDDALRPLTEPGRARFDAVVVGLGRLGLRFERVLHSPWLRAAETAQRLVPLTDGPLRSVAALAAPVTPVAVDALLADASHRGTTALVGHEPYLSELLAALLAPTTPVPLPVRWKKGGVAWLEGDGPAAGAFSLVAFLPPSVLRRVGP
jgi:phosphohistidine phosphatase